MELTRIFIDTKVFMYAVGRPHSLQTEARKLFFQASDNSNWQLSLVPTLCVGMQQ